MKKQTKLIQAKKNLLTKKPDYIKMKHKLQFKKSTIRDLLTKKIEFCSIVGSRRFDNLKNLKYYGIADLSIKLNIIEGNYLFLP